MKQRIPRKHNLVLAVLHEIADAVLRVARRVQRLDGNAADAEGLAVLGGLGHFGAVLAADYLEGLAEGGELVGLVDADGEGKGGISRFLRCRRRGPSG